MTKCLETARVVRNVRITQRLWWCEYEAPGISASARPGQFAHVVCSESDQRDPLLRRPLSFSRVDRLRSTVSFLIDTVGRGTSWLVRQPIGSEIDMLGPLGMGYEFQSGGRRALLVGGGIGLAPLIALADLAPKLDIEIRLLAGGRDIDHITPREWIDLNASYAIATDDGSGGYHGFITDLVPEHFAWSDQIFVCGPTPMMYAMAKLSPDLGEQHGERPVQTALEARMGCAMGVCYSCVVKTTQGVKRVCHDGPVFDQNQLTWEWDHTTPMLSQGIPTL